MDFIELIKQYPIEGSALISTIAASLGWIARNIAQLLLERSKYWREQRTFFWKEKINAAKKASEFYLEYLNLLNLMIIQFNLYKNGKIGHDTLISSIDQEVNFYNNRIKQFPHFEHHHINLFYDFNEKDNLKTVNENLEVLQKVTEMINSENPDDDSIKIEFEKINTNYIKLYDNYFSYIKIVREDLKRYL